jgi:hypothetical protein
MIDPVTFKPWFMLLQKEIDSLAPEQLVRARKWLPGPPVHNASAHGVPPDRTLEAGDPCLDTNQVTVISERFADQNADSSFVSVSYSSGSDPTDDVLPN